MTWRTSKEIGYPEAFMPILGGHFPTVLEMFEILSSVTSKTEKKESSSQNCWPSLKIISTTPTSMSKVFAKRSTEKRSLRSFIVLLDYTTFQRFLGGCFGAKKRRKKVLPKAEERTEMLSQHRLKQCRLDAPHSQRNHMHPKSQHIQTQRLLQ